MIRVGHCSLVQNREHRYKMAIKFFQNAFFSVFQRIVMQSVTTVSSHLVMIESVITVQLVTTVTCNLVMIELVITVE